MTEGMATVIKRISCCRNRVGYSQALFNNVPILQMGEQRLKRTSVSSQIVSGVKLEDESRSFFFFWSFLDNL